MAIDSKKFCSTQAEAAKFAKVDVRTIRRWQEQGLMRDTKRGYLKEHLKAFAASGGAPSTAKSRTQEAEADFREAKARLAMLDLDIKEGRIIEVEEVKKFLAAQVTATKRRLLGLGQKMALRLSAIDEPALIAEAIDEEIEEAIELLVNDFEGTSAR